MTKPIQIIIWIVIILAVGAISYFLITGNSETSDANDDLELSERECLDQG